MVVCCLLSLLINMLTLTEFIETCFIHEKHYAGIVLGSLGCNTTNYVLSLILPVGVGTYVIVFNHILEKDSPYSIRVYVYGSGTKFISIFAFRKDETPFVYLQTADEHIVTQMGIKALKNLLLLDI